MRTETYAALQSAERAGRRFGVRVARAALSLLAFVVLAAIGAALWSGVAARTIGLDYDYLFNRAGIDLSEGSTLVFSGWGIALRRFTPDLANWQALVAGLFNTIKVVLLALISATVIGTLVGAALLSRNFLLRSLSFGYVELIRNTPLLVQLVFWYFGVILSFPPIATAVNWYGWLIVSRRGVYFPAFAVHDGCWHWVGLAALMLLLALWTMARRPFSHHLAFASVAAAASVAVVVFASPIEIFWPTVSRFSASGGAGISPELTGMLLALVVFSAAYIAEIIRGVILSVPKGQSEAATALGLSERQTMTDVILPQVYRVVLPALSNQYVSLAKNTSLGIAIGYPDLFNVSGTIANQTGRNFECIVIVMIAYLLISWGIIGAASAINAALTRRA